MFQLLHTISKQLYSLPVPRCLDYLRMAQTLGYVIPSEDGMPVLTELGEYRLEYYQLLECLDSDACNI